MFRSPTQAPFQNPFSKEGAVASVDWWLSGGISAGDCVAAYQAKASTSLAASYSNLNNPGTNDASLGVAPTWDAVNGWIFNGSTQYLKTGVSPSSVVYSVLVRYTNYDLSTNKGLFGYAWDVFFGMINFSNLLYFRNGGQVSTTQLASGVAGFAGPKSYKDGVEDVTIPTGAAWVPHEVYIGASNFNDAPTAISVSNIQALSIYSISISGEQVTALTNAMNLL